MPNAVFSPKDHALTIKLHGVSQDEARQHFFALGTSMMNCSDHRLSCMAVAVLKALGVEVTCIFCERQKRQSKEKAAL